SAHGDRSAGDSRHRGEGGPGNARHAARPRGLSAAQGVRRAAEEAPVRLRSVALALALAASVAARAPSAPDILDQAADLGAKDRAKGIALIEGYLKDKHEPTERAWAILWAGEQRRLAGNDAEARAWFTMLLDQFPTDRRKQGAVIGIAL